MAAAHISNEHNIPRRYLEQILSTLRQSGLVEAIRGPKGGYRLARTPSQTTVADVVKAVEGDMPPTLCSMPEMRSDNCRTHTGCISRRLCYDLETSLMRVLDGTTLEDLRLEALRLHRGLPDEGWFPLRQLIPTKEDGGATAASQEREKHADRSALN